MGFRELREAQASLKRAHTLLERRVLAHEYNIVSAANTVDFWRRQVWIWEDTHGVGGGDGSPNRQ